MSYLTSTSSTKTPNVCFTLPITCQICLGKVKEPVVCPNLHAFCSFCIEIWLEKSKQCPTCRVPMNRESCRKILGGYDPNDTDKSLVPTDFSHPGTRKARYTALLQDYENEISRLNRQIDSLSQENIKLKETPTHGSSNKYNQTTSPQQDMVQMLKTKLQQTQSAMDELQKENDKFKDETKKLDSENSLLLQEVQRLKASLSEKNAQFTSRYSVAALESKLETYEKEIKQLQKALEKSDKYIVELENQLNGNKNLSIDEFKAPKSLNENLKFIKGDNLTFKNELKVVKFADQPTKIPEKSSSNESQTGSPLKISNNKFYGSPIKTQKSTTTPQITSFADRLKKNLSFDLEVPSPLTQSLNLQSANVTATNLDESKNNLNGGESYLFSPMKRLRLEEFQLEKPSVNESTMMNDTTFNDNNLNASITPEFNDCLHLLNEAESKIQNRSSPFVPKSLTIPKSISQQQLPSPSKQISSNAYQNNDNILPDKYFRPTNSGSTQSGQEKSLNNFHHLSSTDYFKRFSSTDQLNIRPNSAQKLSNDYTSSLKTANEFSIDNLGPYMSASTIPSSRGRSPSFTNEKL